MIFVLLGIVIAVLLVAGLAWTFLRSRGSVPPPVAELPVSAPEPAAVLPEPAPAEPEPEPVEPEPEPEPAPAVQPGVRSWRLRDRLVAARNLLAGYVSDIKQRGRVDQEVWDDLEEALIRADVGLAVTQRLLEELRAEAAGITETEELLGALREKIATRLRPGERSLAFTPGRLNVWMFVGVNGAGKTTTIGKLALREANTGRSIVMAAADTFRAAASDQLKLWAERAGADIVVGQEGADPGSVVFDAMSAVTNRGADLLLVDTAGRLHTKVNLMEELRKLERIVDRVPGALREILLVIDASTGQNGLVQAKQFADTVNVTGIVLTKLDGTPKGGIVLAIADELGIPVKLVGVGETPDDLIEFDPDEFTEALFS